MNIIVTAVDVLLYWLTREERGFLGEQLSCAMDIFKDGSDKRFADVTKKCKGLGFLWCWSRSKKDILLLTCAICHFLHTTENTFNLLRDE